MSDPETDEIKSKVQKILEAMRKARGEFRILAEPIPAIRRCRTPERS